MNPDAFAKLVQSSAVWAEKKPKAYHRSMRRLAARPVRHVALLTVLALGAGVAGAWAAWQGLWWGIGVAAALAVVLLYMAYAPLRVSVPAVPGCELGVSDAPELFAQLERMQKRFKAQALRRVVISERMDVLLHTHRAWSIMGRSQHTLEIGLPLLLRLDSARMLALIARQYAHLRSSDNADLAHIWRCRQAWGAQAQQPPWPAPGVARPWGRSGLLHGFWNRFRPRFMARSIAAARTEEYLASRCAARLCGRDVVAQALTDVALLAQWLPREHWQQFWQLAQTYKAPPLRPWNWLASDKLKPPAEAELQDMLYSVQSEEDDPHSPQPCARRQLDRLQAPLRLPLPCAQHAGALLGAGLTKAVMHFDNQWWEQQRRVWRIAYWQNRQQLVRIGKLKRDIHTLGPSDMQRLAQLFERIGRAQDARVVYAHILQKDPQHAAAFWDGVCALAQHADSRVPRLLMHLVRKHKSYVRQASVVALDVLSRMAESPANAELRKNWIELRDWHTQQMRAWQSEMRSAPLLQNTQVARIEGYALDDLVFSVQRIPAIQTLWLLKKEVRAAPWLDTWIAVVQPVAKHIDLSAHFVQEHLLLSGRVVCVLSHWLPALGASQADLGRPVYRDILQQIQFPAEPDASLSTRFAASRLADSGFGPAPVGDSYFGASQFSDSHISLSGLGGGASPDSTFAASAHSRL